MHRITQTKCYESGRRLKYISIDPTSIQDRACILIMTNSWRTTVALQLNARDQLELHPFSAMLLSHAQLWKSIHHSQSKSIDLLPLKQPPPQELSRLLQSSDVQFKAQLDRFKEKMKEMQVGLEQEVKNSSRSREECTMLREELLRVRRLLELSENKNRQLSKENANLVERVMSEKMKLIEEMNHLTTMYQDLEIKFAAQQGGSSTTTTQQSGGSARQGPIPLDQESARKPEGDFVGATTKRAHSGHGVGFGLGDAVKRGVPSESTAQAVQAEDLFAEPVPSQPVRFQAHDSDVPMLRYDEAGMRLLTCSCDGTIKIWDAWGGALQKTLRSPVDVQIMGLDIKQKIVLGAGSDRAARVWSLETERVVHTLTGHASKLYACRLTSDGKIAVTGGTDRKAMIWDLTTGYRIRNISCTSICNAVAVADDGAYFATGHQDCSVRVWDLRSGKMILSVVDAHTGPISSVEFTRTGKLLTNSRDNSLSLIDLVGGRAEKKFTHPNYKSAFNWSSADASPGGYHVGACGADGNVYIWKIDGTPSDTTKYVLRHSEKRCGGFSFNPAGGGRCASSDEDGVVVVWSPAAQRE